MDKKLEKELIFNSLVDEIKQFKNNKLYRCPCCEKLIEWDGAYYYPEEHSYTCPHCNTTFDENELEFLSILEYIEEMYSAYKIINTKGEIMNKKEKALELMKQLDIYSAYIRGFYKNNDACYYEGFGGFWAYQKPELQDKIKELEEKYNCLVYAVTHEIMEFGECYSFLIVTNYPEEWDELVISNGNKHIAFAYVWNKDFDDYSEFGSIGIQSFGGGIKRIS